MLWEIEIQPRPEGLDREAQGVLSQCRALGLNSIRQVRSARSFLVEGAIDRPAAERMGRELLADPVVETLSVRELPDHTPARGRSEERRVGKECRMPCRSRWSPYH